MNSKRASEIDDWRFVRRVLIVLAIGALAATLWALSDLLLMVFGAVLVAVVLRALMEPLIEVTDLSPPWALLLVVLLIFAAAAALVVPFGSTVAEQTEYLVEQIPVALHAVAQELDVKSPSELFGGSSLGSLAERAFTWGTTLFGAIATAVIVVVGGIYFAAAPKLYREGFVKLFPPRWHDMIGATVSDSGNALRKWLRAQLIAMVIVGLLTGFGMYLVGVPSPVALGLFAAFTEFVPIIGPLAGAVPAVLLASTQGWELMVSAIIVAVIVQQIENNVIMPLIIGRVVDLPAAVAVFAVVAIGVLFGPLGLLLGYPLAIVADVVVRRLYLRETLGEKVTIAGKPAVRAAG